MEIGILNHRTLRTGLSVVAAMLLSTAVHAQDAISTDDTPVLYPIDMVIGDDQGIAVGEPDPNADGGPDIVIGDGDFVPGDPGDDDTGDDDTGDDDTGDDGTGDDGTGDDGAGDDDTGDDGAGGDDGMVWAGGDPNFCEACGVEMIDGLPVEAYQMSAGGVVQDQPVATTAAKPRRSSALPTLSNALIDCLALHPQLPWICEWQIGAGN